MNADSNVGSGEETEDSTEIIHLTYHDVAEILEKLSQERGGFRLTEQRRVYEYVQKFLFASKKEIHSLIDKLESELNIPRQVAIQMAYTLPITPEEFEPFIIQLRRLGYREINADEFIAKAVKIISPVWRKNINTILALRNINLAELGIKKKD